MIIKFDEKNIKNQMSMIKLKTNKSNSMQLKN